MGYYSYLVRTDNKTMFELGKTMNWSTSLKLFKVTKDSNLLEYDHCSEEEYIDQYHINDNNLLLKILKKHFSGYEYDEECSNLEYIEYVKDKILNFCDNKKVFFIRDNYDSFLFLKDDGYEIVDSRYYNNDK